MKIPRSPFWVGFIGHLVFWLLVVNLDSTPMDFDCGETSCWVLVATELPFSLVYMSGGGKAFLAGSLLVGSCWWGLLAYVVSRIPVGGSDWPARRRRPPPGVDDRPPRIE
jgi:hypothetical protein